MSGGPPSGAVPYKRTPVFDQDSLPDGLRHEHRTKAGVWGLIRVLDGRLRYRVIDPPNEQVLSPELPGLVRPEQRHEVTPLGQVRFFVEFYASEPVIGAPD
jgi:tellurite resistance-related uncharacterized protein